MRLVCPNCGAQYEVPSGVIPEDGRDVQCSNCGHTWFEPHPDSVAAASAEPAPEATVPEPEPVAEQEPEPEETPPLPDYEPEPEPEAAPAPEIAPEAAPSRVDPSVADVLRQEAEYEARARAAETAGALETQPDLGLDEADGESRRAREAQERMARMRGEDRSAEQVEAAVAATVAAETDRPRRDQLPDIEDINATLRSSKEPRLTDRNEPPPHVAVAEADRRSFRRGFLLMVLIAVVLVALYVFAPRIADTVPQAKAPLDQYVATVDEARVWLDDQLARGLQWLDSMASEASAPSGGTGAEPETAESQ
ncbi:zinc-ribbon domain-containing protein [Pseudaestuariivita atlantica]|uniref:Zinc finger/thioredoxin putative domain-containing protein n=1 Tax=Pseudaestuariivita atlantica TaxID=1317121 RepID=A0A0L1JRH2_9RHOB|nr:zinc-ribbon domain-containing protein [Pseudaestuariivita atlantica]KNG94399.1 hypothetical protein ATO11_09415 [Pseudaestuariivita atlantica]